MLGETITYTITQFIPYTSGNYTSLVFTDVLDDALDISSATVTVYRTDTLNGTARASDSSNWSITRNRTSNTVTATHRNPGNAGGTYEFVITVDVDEDADLTSYSTSTTSSGNTGYVVPNTASFKYNSTTKTSNRVTFLVPIARVQYRIVGTDNPSDSTVPSSVTSYAGVTYTIEDELTTSDASVVWYFDGWYYDSNWTQPATGTITLPEGTTTLYGHWLVSEIALEKTVSSTTLSNASAGDTITYTFTIYNTGSTSLTDVTLYDELLGGEITLSRTDMEASIPIDYMSVSVPYTLTQADIDSGTIYNTATVTAKNPGGSTVTDTDDATVTITQNPNIDLKKTASTTLVEDAVAGNTTVTYTFTITNTGNVTLSNITLSDDMLGGGITLNNTTLAPGENTTVDKTYTLTQDDIDTGSVYNEATVTGTPPSGSNVTATDYATVKIEWSPALEIVKTSVSGTTIQDATAGTVVTYEITVTNTGNVTLSNINVYDELDGVSIDTSNLMGTLSPSGSFTITATYTLTQDDVDRGYVYNNAFATSTTPDAAPVAGVNDDDETVELPSNPSIELVKTADVDIVESATAGVSTITYMFTVTNTGNTTLNNIVLTDPLLGGEIELNETTLAPNVSTFGTATYTVTQDDIDTGIVTNTATVTGDDPQGTGVSNDSTEETNIEQLPAVDLVKEVMGDATITDAYVGDWVQFAVTVTNTGNTTLYNITITDLLEGAVFVVDELEGVTFNDDNVVVDTMLPGDTTTVYVDYQLTQADIDRGDTENIANVTATPPGDLEEVSDDDDAVIETPSDPSISLTKTANVESVEFALPGDIIYYTLTITNTGNTTISNLTLYDELLGGDITESLDKTTIVPGESATALLSYTLTQDDIDTGSVYNFATATGEDPNGTGVDDEDDYTVELIANPSITLTKTVAPVNDVASEDLTTDDELVYTLIIANNGNQTLTNIILYDELLGGEIDLSNAVKGVDMMVINYEASDEDTIEDEAVEDDDDIDGIALTDEKVVETVEETVVADDTASISTRAYYTEHTMVSSDDPITTLRPGEYLLVEVTYIITQDDMDTGCVDNIASVTTEGPNGNGMSDEDAAVMYLPQHPGITLVKEASFNSLAGAGVGDVINYTLTITNTGDVSLTNLTLTDELDGIVIDTSVLDGLTLIPGETVVATAEYSLTEADLLTGSVYNHATVIAESVVPYDEDNIWSGSQQVSDDDDALVNGIVAVADDLILAQTGENILMISGCVLVGLVTTASIAAGYISKQRRIK